MEQIETEPRSDGVKQVPKISNGTSQNGTSSPDSGHPSSRNFSVTSGQSDSISTEDSGIHEPNLKAPQPPTTAHITKPNHNSDQSEMGASESETQMQRTEQDDLKATQSKVDDMHRTAPVVEETVVPLVHEAFSRREMSEAQAADESDESPSAIEMEDIPTANVCMAWKSPSKTSEQTAVPLLKLGLEEKISHEEPVSVLPEEPGMENLCPQFDSLAVNAEKNEVTSPVSSVGTTYSVSMFQRCILI